MSKRAVRLLAQFDAIVQVSQVLPVTIPILRRAAQLWSTAKTLGHAQNDADLLIATTALEHDLALVTGNHRHFNWIEGLQIETWD